MKDNLELQLGRVEAINSDGTITIRDFRTGGVINSNVDIEHTAANQYQPVVGEHVLFFTMGAPLSARQAKIVRFYGSSRADQDIVRSSPIDLQPGEHRMVSQTGNMVYVANGAVYLSGLGQSILLADNPNITKITSDNLQIVTTDGTLIHEQNGTLTISKGELTTQDDGATMAIPSPTMSISITGDTISINGASVTIETNVKEVRLNGTTSVARKDDLVKSTPAESNDFWKWIAAIHAAVVTVSGGSFPPPGISLPTQLTSKIIEGSSKVKSG